MISEFFFEVGRDNNCFQQKCADGYVFQTAVWCQGGEGPEGLIRIVFGQNFPVGWRVPTSRGGLNS